MGQSKGCIPWNKGKIGLQHCPEWKKEKMRSLIGKKHPMWKGGISKNKAHINNRQKERRHKIGISKNYNCKTNGLRVKRCDSQGREYAENWGELRKNIYKRDKWLCQECKIKCHGNGTKDKIQCHHIDYNVGNNESSNLITLCASCHSKTNFKKVDWTKYFSERRNQT